MNIIDKFSFFIFCTFFISYLLKLFILNRKNGIKANVLAKGGKSKDIDNVELLVKVSTFVWGVSWLILSVTSSNISGFIILNIESGLLRYAGITVLAIGCFIFEIAMLSMKTSWRVGIDKKTKSSLVTTGIYKYSRNPAFVGFDTMFIGFALTYPSLLTAIITILNIYSIHRLILKEEKHLSSTFGDTYLVYKDNTPRYILFK